MKNIFLLGATGSIGSQVIEVIRNKDFRLLTISVGNNIDKAINIIKEFNPLFVSCINKEDSIKLQKLFPSIEVGYGNEGLLTAATYKDYDGVLVNAVSSSVGLIPTIEAIKKNRDILLANKETLVVAGPLIKRLVKEHNVKLIPIDSEHSAIFKCIQNDSKNVQKLIITASGGAFRDLTRDELNNITLEDALKHPNWRMGNKITIDCATMANKGLEVIEAHYLFDIPYDRIEVVLHRESIIHSMVQFNDSSIISEAYNPNMMIPIQYALEYPNRIHNSSFQEIDFNKQLELTFSKMDYDRFPLLKMAYEAGKSGEVAPIVYNASNEAAVDLFMRNKISFLEIERIVEESLKETKSLECSSVYEILEIEKNVKKQIYKKYEVR